LKTFFVYILFFVFALRPIYNIGYVAYFELNIDYIIETYCVNKEKPKLQCGGKCHLAKQLTLDTSDNNKAISHLGGLYHSFFPVFYKAYALEHSFTFVEFSFENNWYYNSTLLNLYKDHLDPPPRNLA